MVEEEVTGLAPEAHAVLDYWFGREPAQTVAQLEAKLLRWFGDESSSQQIKTGFPALIESALAGGLEDWEESAMGQLALIVVLDQFARSFYGMGDGRAFSGGARAEGIALALSEAGLPPEWDSEKCFIALMPLGHAESSTLHKRAVDDASSLVTRAPLHLRPIFETITSQLVQFMAVLTRFGRYPHRNEALGRDSTPAEIEFLRTWSVRHPADYREQIETARTLEKDTID